MKNLIIVLVVIILVIIGAYFVFCTPSDVTVTINEPTATSTTATSTLATTTKPSSGSTSVIGQSVEKRNLTAYHFGSGDTEILFVGGIHGGYEWNTSLVAFQLADYLKQNPTTIPANVRVTVIPVLNPDGLFKVTGKDGRFAVADVPTGLAETVPGRYNANTVDLNRNFDCDWQASGKWQNITVSGGTSAFSEPESQAIRNYVETNKPSAVVVYYSAAGGVFSSSCHNGVLPETATLTNTYAKAADYKAYENFDFYEITGDMVNWLAKEKVPAISVLLTNHTDTEWTKNLAGIKALLTIYAK